jgi:hypothetical protein
MEKCPVTKYPVHRQNVEEKTPTVKNVDGQNVEQDKKLTEKTSNGKKTLKGQNVKW